MFLIIPKIWRNKIALLKSWIEDDSNFIDESNERNVYCEPCNKSIKYERKSQLVQHVNTATHKKRFEAANTSEKDTSQQLPTSSKKMNFTQISPKQ